MNTVDILFIQGRIKQKKDTFKEPPYLIIYRSEVPTHSAVVIQFNSVAPAPVGDILFIDWCITWITFREDSSRPTKSWLKCASKLVFFVQDIDFPFEVFNPVRRDAKTDTVGVTLVIIWFKRQEL